MLYDKDIREPLFDFLELKYGKNRIFEEKRMGGSRADVVMVLPDKVVGLEIKSDADTYTRLEGQVADYDLYFDMNYVVVGTSHAAHIEEHVPDYWGIITVEIEDGKVDFYILKEPMKNPNSCVINKIRLLWRPELSHIQELNGLHKYNDKSKDYVRRYIVDSVEESVLNRQISEELFERDYEAIRDAINEYRQKKGQKKRRNKKRRKSTV